MRNDVIFDLLAIDAAAEQTLERRDAAVRDPAWNDEAEVIEIGRGVECEAVAGDPPRDPDADRREFLVSDPDAGQSVDARRLDAVVCRGSNQDFLEIANVAVHVLPVWLQIEDGIADDLSGTVIRDVAAAARLVNLDAACRQQVRRGEDVRAAAVAADAER